MLCLTAGHGASEAITHQSVEQGMESLEQRAWDCLQFVVNIKMWLPPCACLIFLNVANHFHNKKQNKAILSFKTKFNCLSPIVFLSTPALFHNSISKVYLIYTFFLESSAMLPGILRFFTLSFCTVSQVCHLWWTSVWVCMAAWAQRKWVNLYWWTS